MKKYFKKLMNIIARLLHIKKKDEQTKDSSNLNNNINIISCDIRYIEEK